MASTSYASLLDQQIHIVPQFTLESGRTLRQVPVAYKTWGKLNSKRDNVMVICHAFTGSADVEDWWGPLMGRNKVFDPHHFFIFCANCLGSPYGSASPLTINPNTGRPYGRDFPRTSIRDDVRIQKHVLDHLNVSSVAAVIGGSMGGMAALEWPLCSPPNYIRACVPLATSARHSAWCISWGEAQRQSIYSDPAFRDGEYYENGEQPKVGLAAARMTALLTYRSRDSFESRFGRTPQRSKSPDITSVQHTNGNGSTDATANAIGNALENTNGRKSTHINEDEPLFSAQSYLRYQGDKFTARFDANCYVHITRKMDTHDLARGRSSPNTPSPSAMQHVLSHFPASSTLIIGIASDGLFTTTEQEELASLIPNAELVVIPSPDGHDGFLLEFKRINQCVKGFLRRVVPEVYEEATGEREEGGGGGEVEAEDFATKKDSLFGEAEADVTRW